MVYGHKAEPQAVKVDSRELTKIYQRAGGNKIISLKLDDSSSKNALFADVQNDPRTGAIIHADFYLVKMDEKIKTEVPVHLTGESTAVYQQEGTLVKNLETIEVEALPGELPESFEVDISILDDFDKSIHVSDLVVPEGVTLLTDPEELLVKVDPPRSDEELAELEEAPEETLPEGVAEEGAEAEAVEEEGGTSEGNADKEQKSEPEAEKGE